ncbi:AAA family ATPase [Candidatus Palauibacter sp.]|uniref:AAA family ATPase n=1 Tax=Candidatus Palauibacter sp. TaxID=3101350 RepID=UPI003D15278D
MTQETPGNRLHLPTLAIAGFRGIRELSIRRLGRVTLLTGNNGAGKTTVLDAVRMGADTSSPAVRCRSLGPGVLEDDRIAKWWSAVAPTVDQDKVVDALRLVVDGVESADVVAEHTGRQRPRDRVIVRLKGDPAPVPLKHLGDGAVRVFGVALALANSRNGFLLIDEVENGIHHSVQKRFWRMVLETAEANNVQVLATTHSRDCVEGFAQAAAECQHIEGALARINRRNGETWAVEYPEKDMWVAAEQGIEVR